MDAARASVTALATSLIRSVHTRCDQPKLLDDPYGERFVTEQERSLILQRLLLTLTPARRAEIERVLPDDAGRAFDMAIHSTPGYVGVLVRVCYSEEHLSAAIERGVSQYVLIGAGLDTFAFRRPALAARLEIFELDHQATQGLKRERMSRTGLEPPANVHFVATDFESESVAAALSRSSFRRGAPAFFAWLGVTPYLSREANLATLRSIAASAAAGSEIVFDYIEAAALAPERASEEAERMVAERRATDEPYLSGFDPMRLAGDLAPLGIELIEDLGPRDIEARYCAGRADGLRFTAPGHLVRARTASTSLTGRRE
jgi:methyltransferase (TIGR00027 family)